MMTLPDLRTHDLNPNIESCLPDAHIIDGARKYDGMCQNYTPLVELPRDPLG